MLKKILSLILQHKFIAGLIILAILGAGWWGYVKITGSTTATRYILAVAEKGILIVSVSGSGQISASNQVDVKAKTSGDITGLPVKNGQAVKAGAILAQINAQDVYKAVRDAQASLESAELAMEKLKQPADELTILQAQNSLAQAEESKTNAEDDLKKAYDDGFNNVANAFLDLPTVMTGLENILYGTELGGGGIWNLDYYGGTAAKYDESGKAKTYRADAAGKYQTARDQYDKSFENYKTASRFSDNNTIKELISESYETTKTIAEAIKSANNLTQFYKDTLTENSKPIPALADTQLTSLNSYTKTTNTHLLNLLGATQTIATDKKTITNSGRTIAEKTASLADLKAGADPLDIRSQELTLKQRQNALLDAQENLANSSVRAPFAGVIAEISAKKGDTVSSGATIATLITKQKIAEISLNEVDVAKVKTGQKATLTFDAVPDLSITGEVAEVDTLGAVTSGVVSYGVKIAFDVQDERIKPGMSMSANIVIESKPDVLLVPVSALKTAGNESYVQILVDGAPQQKTVTAGLSSDTQIEITEGLNEGDQVITQTITGNSAGTASTNANRSRNNAMGGMMMIEGGGTPR